MTRTFLVLGAVLLVLAGWPASETVSPSGRGAGLALLQHDVRIFGPGRLYTIATRIVRPAGDGPFGVIVLSHGAPVSAAARAEESPEMLMHAASVFARRGYVVVLPVRRGFGATGGWFAEGAGTCSDPDYWRGEAAAAEDILVAYDFARRLPYVDPNRMILVGQSAGAVASLAAAARNPKGLVAVLAFSPGRGGNPVLHPGQPCAPEALAELFARLGRMIEVPVLFHYAANDQFFNTQVSRLWFERFAAGGAPAQYVLQPPFGDDGHFIFSAPAGSAHWVPVVERFLKSLDLPFTATRSST